MTKQIEWSDPVTGLSRRLSVRKDYKVPDEGTVFTTWVDATLEDLHHACEVAEVQLIEGPTNTKNEEDTGEDTTMIDKLVTERDSARRRYLKLIIDVGNVREALGAGDTESTWVAALRVAAERDLAFARAENAEAELTTLRARMAGTLPVASDEKLFALYDRALMEEWGSSRPDSTDSTGR